MKTMTWKHQTKPVFRIVEGWSPASITYSFYDEQPSNEELIRVFNMGGKQVCALDKDGKILDAYPLSCTIQIIGRDFYELSAEMCV